MEDFRSLKHLPLLLCAIIMSQLPWEHFLRVRERPSCDNVLSSENGRRPGSTGATAGHFWLVGTWAWRTNAPCRTFGIVNAPPTLKIVTVWDPTSVGKNAFHRYSVFPDSKVGSLQV